jgi:hypothetical protein
LIYVRSRRPLLTAAGTAVALGGAFAIVGWVAWYLPGGAIPALVLWAGTLGTFAVGVWAGVRLRAWPPCRLAFFRDRLVVLSGRHEMRALWDQIQAVTLADLSSWPVMRLTDSLTLTFRAEGPIRFKPRDFGLDPAGCRDLLARLRDEPELRDKLPEFDSQRDLDARPLVAGEATEPKF